MKQHLYRMTRDRNHYNIHQSLCNWTPDGRVLFGKKGKYFWLQAPDGFSPDFIPDKFAEYIETVDVPMYSEGDIVELWSVINPTKKRNSDKKLMPLAQEEIPEWMVRKFAGCADVLDVQINHTCSITIIDRIHRIHDVCILIRVKDKYKLFDLMRSGIGRAKYLGMGMLRVRK